MKAIKIFIFLTVIVLNFNVYGQKFEGGVKLGLVGSQVAGDKLNGYNKTGLCAGLWVNLPISIKSRLQMELSYIQKGSRQNANHEKGVFNTYIMRVNYIELPFLYQYSLVDKLNIEAGGAYAHRVNSNESENGENFSLSQFKNYDISAIFGISYNFTNKFKANIRTAHSLFSIRSKHNNGDVWRLWGYGQFHDILVISIFYYL